jgi:RNA polymerase sigma-70 factor (ECF subfamily)
MSWDAIVDALLIDAEFSGVLVAAQSGDQAAVGLLYRAYNPALVRFFAGRAPAVKEDLAQEVWLSVAASLGTFAGDEGQFRAWLFTIARRRTIDHWRMVRRRPAEVVDESLDIPQREQPDRLDIQAAISELTAGLSAEQAEVVLLRVVAGLTVEQVAEIVGKSPGAIRVMQHRALRRLAAQISTRCVTP